jgi:hypothetical protein
MKKNAIQRGIFAAVTAVSLAFGAVQAFAAPSDPIPWSDVCRYYDPSVCRSLCGPGCGGTCVNYECLCDC